MGHEAIEFPLTIEPAGGEWRGLMRRGVSEEAKEFRREVGLPVDRPVVMTGHHTFFWHPGILAKYLAADAAAVALGAAPAWLVVDQERSQVFEAHYPVRREDGRLGENWVEYLGRVRGAGDAVAVRDRAQRGERPALPWVVEGREKIEGALRGRASAPPYAAWQTGALVDLTQPYRLIKEEPAVVLATGLSRTKLFARLVEKMGRDPEGCIGAYNAAVARHPLSGVRPLTADAVQDRWELPLWWLPPGEERRHVYAEDLGTIPLEQLAPKALFMTGLVRLAGCDLFIHGVGGGARLDEAAGRDGYDHITEDWVRAWLGVELAPMVVVTATLRLPLLDGPAPTAEQVARAVWLAHHARHNPDVLRDGYAADAKAKLVAEIGRVKVRPRAVDGRVRREARQKRHELFKRMQGVLEGYRASHAADLAALEGNAAEARGKMADGAVAFDRTWAFSLYPEGMIGALVGRIRAEFGVE